MRRIVLSLLLSLPGLALAMAAKPLLIGEGALAAGLLLAFALPLAWLMVGGDSQVAHVIFWLVILAISLALLAPRLLKLARADFDVPVWIPHVSLCIVGAIIAAAMLRRSLPPPAR